MLRRHGFDWTGLQADHVQDIQWDGPDQFRNLWPMSSSANLSAGPRQNDNPVVTFCLNTTSPAPRQISLRQMKAEGRAGLSHFGRWFTVTSVQRRPPVNSLPADVTYL